MRYFYGWECALEVQDSRGVVAATKRRSAAKAMR